MLSERAPDVEIVGEADTVVRGYELVKIHTPDLVFLDIQLKDGTGFDILSKLHTEGEINFEIIFFTAHGNLENATKAIEYSALRFITKPIDPQKLKDAVEKARQKMQKTQQNLQIALLLENLTKGNNPKPKRIAIHLVKGVMEIVEVDNIMRLEADGTITYVYLGDQTELIAMKNLGFYSKLLIADYDFFPISNKVVVNMDFVKRYKHNELTVFFKDGTTAFASRRGGQEFKKFLSDNKSRFGNIQSSGMGDFFKNILGS